MNYKDLKQLHPDKEFGQFTVVATLKIQRDCETKWVGGQPSTKCAHQFNDDHEYTLSYYKISLPHSCDEWAIGELRDAEDFALHLQEAIVYMRTLPNPPKNDT